MSMAFISLDITHAGRCGENAISIADCPDPAHQQQADFYLAPFIYEAAASAH